MNIELNKLMNNTIQRYDNIKIRMKNFIRTYRFCKYRCDQMFALLRFVECFM